MQASRLVRSKFNVFEMTLQIEKFEAGMEECVQCQDPVDWSFDMNVFLFYYLCKFKFLPEKLHVFTISLAHYIGLQGIIALQTCLPYLLFKLHEIEYNYWTLPFSASQG